MFPNSLHAKGQPSLHSPEALVIDFVLGVLIGQGRMFTTVAAALLLTLLLSLKSKLSSFAGGLRPEEIRSPVLLGLIGFVIDPLLPDRFIDTWNLRESWITVIVIAAIGFANYVPLRLYGSRGLLYTAVLGGVVNSTASSVSNLPVICRVTGNARMTRSLAVKTTVIALTGAAVTAAEYGRRI